jgi:hypothetical protein
MSPRPDAGFVQMGEQVGGVLINPVSADAPRAGLGELCRECPFVRKRLQKSRSSIASTSWRWTQAGNAAKSWLTCLRLSLRVRCLKRLFFAQRTVLLTLGA